MAAPISFKNHLNDPDHVFNIPHIYNHEYPDLTNLRVQFDHSYLNGDSKPCITYHMIHMADVDLVRKRIAEQKPEVDMNCVKFVKYDPVECGNIRRADKAPWYARQKKEKEMAAEEEKKAKAK